MRHAILALALMACADIDDTPPGPNEPPVDYCGPLSDYELMCCLHCGQTMQVCELRRDTTLSRSQFWCEHLELDRSWCYCGRY